MQKLENILLFCLIQVFLKETFSGLFTKGHHMAVFPEILIKMTSTCFGQNITGILYKSTFFNHVFSSLLKGAGLRGVELGS